MSISRYFFLLLTSLFLVCSRPAAAQPDSLFRPSLFVGMDVSGFARELMEPGLRQWEWSMGNEWRKNWFAVMEGGFLDIEIENPTHNYFANGWFMRAGVDYNLLERNERNVTDMILLNFRYGFGTVNHESTFITISNPYWGDHTSGLPQETYNTHWLELGAEIRARLIADLYLGWSIRSRVVVSRTQNPAMDPYIISGYGKTEKNPTVMIHYSIFYRFPL